MSELTLEQRIDIALTIAEAWGLASFFIIIHLLIITHSENNAVILINTIPLIMWETSLILNLMERWKE